MNDFQTMLAADMAALSAVDFGETLDYVFKNGAVIKALPALVFRTPPEKTGATPRMQSTQVQVDISKALLTATPMLDGDRVVIANGSTTKSLTVVKLNDESDPGAWHLVVN